MKKLGPIPERIADFEGIATQPFNGYRGELASPFNGYGAETYAADGPHLRDYW